MNRCIALVVVSIALPLAGCPRGEYADVEHGNVCIDLSPDGRSVVFSSADGDLYLLKLATKTVTRLTDTERTESYPSFSPDGNNVVFAASAGETGPHHVFLLDLSIFAVEQLTDGLETSDILPRFRADGKRIVFARAYRHRPYSLGGWTWDKWDACGIFGDPKVNMGLHYLVADATGKAASIEFLDGKMVCYSGPDLPVKALTNLPYKECLAYVETGEGDASKSLNSLPRFSRATTSVKEFASENPMADRDYAFKTLDNVVSGNAQSRTKTVWSIVYDIANRRVYYRSHKNPNLRWVFMEDFDFSPEVSARYLDINADGEGHVAEKSRVLTHDVNAEYVRKAANQNQEETKKLMGDSKASRELYLFFIRSYQPKR